MVKIKSEDDGEMDMNLYNDGPYFFKIMYGTLNSEQLRIPPLFVKHMSKELSDTATLEGPSDDHWIVKVKVRGGGIYFQNGWKEFRRHHSPWNNEFLLFRYDGGMRFKVQIFYPNGCERIDSIAKQPESVPTDVKRKGGRPRKILVTPEPSEDCSGQHLPRDKSTKLQKVKEAKDDEKRFLTENSNLPLHELCSMKIEAEDSQMKTQTKDIDLTKETDVDGFSGEGSSGEKASGISKEAKSFTSKNPHIQVFISKGSTNILRFRKSFANMHLPRRKTKIVLRNLDGHAWEVSYSHAAKHSICKGWVTFLRDNNINVGDICIFDLVDKNEFKVHHFEKNQG